MTSEILQTQFANEQLGNSKNAHKKQMLINISSLYSDYVIVDLAVFLT